MTPNEYYEYEDRAYLSPTLSRDEQMSFVDTLRDTVGKDAAQINAQTQALGTDIPSNLGGLTGSGGYFAQRYQTTPVEAQVKNLKATAQAKALSDLMTNYQTQAQNRYNQAYRSYNKRSGSFSGGSSGGGTGSNGSNAPDDNTSGWNGEIDENPNNSPIQYTYAYKIPYKDPVKVFINNDASADESARILSRLGQGSDGRLETVDGVQYVWSNYGKYGPTWYRVLF